MTVEKSADGRTVVLKGLPLTPRVFSVRDADGKAIEGAMGSLGYGSYSAIMVDGLRHNLTMNVVVNKSKSLPDSDKQAWLDAHKDAIEADVAGYADTFRNASNTGWRFNSQTVVAGQACTVSGSLVLSGKTVKAVGKKAKRAAERLAREEAAAAKHEAALVKARADHDKAIAALKASVKA